MTEVLKEQLQTQIAALQLQLSEKEEQLAKVAPPPLSVFVYHSVC
jgi:hypothetical protein